MLADNLHNKKIALLGRRTLLGKIMLKKLVKQFGSCISSLLIIDMSKAKKSYQALYEETFIQDEYMKDVDSGLANKIVQFINIKQQPQKQNQIDIVYNCLTPADYTRTQIDKCLQIHLWKTFQVCDFLKKFGHIQKLVMASSIYCQSPGYVSENSKNSLSKLMGFVPNMQSTVKALEQIKDTFNNQMQIWQWSILFMELTYGKQQYIKKIDIVRMPQVGPTVTDYEGFIMNFNTFMTLIYEIGYNILDSLEGVQQNIIDLIPADYAVNYMISISAISPSPLVSNDQIYQIKANKGQQAESQSSLLMKLSIYNLSSSSRNPIQLGKFSQYVVQAWTEFSEKKVNFSIKQKKWQRQLYVAKNDFPRQVKNRVAVLFDIKPWKIKTQQEHVVMLKKKETMKKYRYYLQKQWICESNKSIDYFFSMTQQDQVTFNFNVNTINWRTYAKLCCYSVKKYLLGLQVQKFSPSNMDLLNFQRSSYFSDIIWALTGGKSVQSQTSQQIKNYILSTKSVKEAIKILVEEQTGKLQQTPTAYQKVQGQYYKIADEMCEQMFSQYSMKSIRGFAWFLHKIFRTIYQKVVIDKTSMLKLNSFDEKTHGPLIIIPTHRSYIDFLIMSYVFFSYGIKVPHIAAAEDFLNMAVVHILLRKSGAFFIKRNQKKNRILYKAVMNEYISKLLGENHYLQFFIQGTRSRSGKMLSPKYGILSIVAKNVLEGKIPDAQILPATLNYQKVLQGTSFTYEMMGESKVKQSLSRLIKGVDTLKQNFGRIYIQFCEPISVKQYFKINQQRYAHKKDGFQLNLNDLGYKIVYAMSNKLVITPPAILSSIILMNRIGISDQRLSEKVQWLCKQISGRNFKIARTQADSSVSISNTLLLMEDIVNKSKKDMFQVQVSFDQFSFVQLFTLTYYRNTLTHIFFEEAIVAVALASFGYQKMVTGQIQITNLIKAIKFLRNLLNKQFVLQHFLEDQARIMNVLQYMQSREVLKKTNDDKIFVLHPDGNLFSFYCSLVWPVIQSYWITCLYLFKLQKDNLLLQMPKLQSEIQWFGQSLFTERLILHLEAISMDTLKNSTATLQGMKIISQVKQNGKQGVKVTASQDILKQVQSKISSFLKSKYAGSLKGIISAGRGSVNLDFPFLSKL